MNEVLVEISFMVDHSRISNAVNDMAQLLHDDAIVRVDVAGEEEFCRTSNVPHLKSIALSLMLWIIKTM